MRKRDKRILQVLPRKESIHREVHLLSGAERSALGSVEGRMSGPGDRAPKWPLMWVADAVNGAAGYSTHPMNGRVDGCTHRGPRVRQAQKPLAQKLGDLEGASSPVVGGRQPGEGSEPQSLVATFEKSDAVVVPRKSTKTRVTPVEPMEGRTKAKGTP